MHPLTAKLAAHRRHQAQRRIASLALLTLAALAATISAALSLTPN